MSELEKLICPQCGGNDLQPFGNSAYKCESCGTILKDEPKEKIVERIIEKPNAQSQSHYVAPVTSEFLTSEERYADAFQDTETEDDVPSGESFMKTILILFGLGVAALALYYLVK